MERKALGEAGQRISGVGKAEVFVVTLAGEHGEVVGRRIDAGSGHLGEDFLGSGAAVVGRHVVEGQVIRL